MENTNKFNEINKILEDEYICQLLLTGGPTADNHYIDAEIAELWIKNMNSEYLKELARDIIDTNIYISNSDFIDFLKLSIGNFFEFLNDRNYVIVTEKSNKSGFFCTLIFMLLNRTYFKKKEPLEINTNFIDMYKKYFDDVVYIDVNDIDYSGNQAINTFVNVFFGAYSSARLAVNSWKKIKESKGLQTKTIYRSLRAVRTKYSFDKMETEIDRNIKKRTAEFDLFKKIKTSLRLKETMSNDELENIEQLFFNNGGKTMLEYLKQTREINQHNTTDKIKLYEAMSENELGKMVSSKRLKSLQGRKYLIKSLLNNNAKERNAYSKIPIKAMDTDEWKILSNHSVWDISLDYGLIQAELMPGLEEQLNSKYGNEKGLSRYIDIIKFFHGNQGPSDLARSNIYLDHKIPDPASTLLFPFITGIVPTADIYTISNFDYNQSGYNRLNNFKKRTSSVEYSDRVFAVKESNFENKDTKIQCFPLIKNCDYSIMLEYFAEKIDETKPDNITEEEAIRKWLQENPKMKELSVKERELKFKKVSYMIRKKYLTSPEIEKWKEAVKGKLLNMIEFLYKKDGKSEGVTNRCPYSWYKTFDWHTGKGKLCQLINRNEVLQNILNVFDKYPDYFDGSKLEEFLFYNSKNTPLAYMRKKIFSKKGGRKKIKNKYKYKKTRKNSPTQI